MYMYVCNTRRISHPRFILNSIRRRVGVGSAAARNNIARCPFSRTDDTSLEYHTTRAHHAMACTPLCPPHTSGKICLPAAKQWLAVISNSVHLISSYLLAAAAAGITAYHSNRLTATLFSLSNSHTNTPMPKNATYTVGTGIPLI